MCYFEFSKRSYHFLLPSAVLFILKISVTSNIILSIFYYKITLCCGSTSLSVSITVVDIESKKLCQLNTSNSESTDPNFLPPCLFGKLSLIGYFIWEKPRS